MKYLFWLLVIVLVWWAWRRSRSSAAPPTPPTPSSPTSPPQDMCVCLHCGVHLPRSEALQGQLGPYCSTSHRSAAGDRNPA